jgi:hypothetical protein
MADEPEPGAGEQSGALDGDSPEGGGEPGGNIEGFEQPTAHTDDPADSLAVAGPELGLHVAGPVGLAA